MPHCSAIAQDAFDRGKTRETFSILIGKVSPRYLVSKAVSNMCRRARVLFAMK
jgi:hypothetical protein